MHDAQGNRLSLKLLLVTSRDEFGRPRDLRVMYEEKTVGEEMSADVKNECLLVWMTDYQLAKRTS